MYEAQILKTAGVMLVLVGSVMHIYYFNSILKVTRSLEQGWIRIRLVWLTLMVGLFSALYLVFALFSTHTDDTGLILLVSVMLFLGAVFVMITSQVLTGVFGVVKSFELIEKQRISDESMGIYNRVYFDLRLKEAHLLARRHRQTFSILLLEIDYLDQISHSHGMEYTGKFLASLGKLIKTSGSSTVYYCGADGKRYVFPSSGVYFSWYENFSGVITITTEELSSLPLGGNVTYRPGSRMVKIQTDPKTYAVDVGGVLRWVSSAEIAESMYGNNWNTQIDDISPAFFINYTLGEPITAPLNQ